jgi:hypothetical protein
MSKQEASELSALLQLYLEQEFKRDAWITTDRDVYAYFKTQAQTKKTVPPSHSEPAAPPPSQPKNVQPPPQPPSPIPKPRFDAKPPQPSLQTEPVKQEKAEKLTNKEPAKTAQLSSPNTKEEKKKVEDPVFFTLEPLSSPAAIDDLQDIKTLVKEKNPGLIILEGIPDDAEAKRTRIAWKRQQETPHVLVLCFNENNEQAKFLHNIANAIQVRFAPTKVIQASSVEKQQGWGTLLNHKELKFIIANDYSLYSMPGLMKHYRDNPERGERFLGTAKLCLMADSSLYFKDPRLKGVLWKAICTLLQNAG